MSTVVSLPPTGIRKSFSLWLLWGIWTTRNLLIFENRATSAKSVVEKMVSAAREWLLAQATGGERIPGLFNDYDRPTFPPEVTLCNTDAAWLISKRAGLGWCFENRAQSLSLEGSRSLNHVSSPLMAEALDMRGAIQEAKRISLNKVWFRTDSQELSRAINLKSYPVELFGVLMDIDLLSSSFVFFYVSFIGRALNGTADSLAKSALHSFVSPLY
ncbi:hypothetical protein Bca52824_035966 [Brassica carinata]|uniref:RNase H type-1 domain-containing protein n=1 Tax=Brassica carinata TaxID=52824 RepID=A0A8X7S332_BRACI|nr:hypothetical protein Bca52824_035966 [Brassica carinata]